MTDSVNVEQCDREARNRLMKLIDCMGGEEDCWQIDQALARYRIAERERCAGIAKTGWVSADYNIVGIADADVAMQLCEHIETAIREPKP